MYHIYSIGAAFSFKLFFIQINLSSYGNDYIYQKNITLDINKIDVIIISWLVPADVHFKCLHSWLHSVTKLVCQNVDDDEYNIPPTGTPDK